MTRVEKRRKRLIHLEVELLCPPGTTKAAARREVRERLNHPTFRFWDVDVRAKRVK